MKYQIYFSAPSTEGRAYLAFDAMFRSERAAEEYLTAPYTRETHDKLKASGWEFYIRGTKAQP